MKDHQNITLSLPKEILIKIKHIAVDRQTSVSALLAKTLEEVVKKEDAYEKARKHYFQILEEDLVLGTKGRPVCKREELHER